MFKRWIGFSVHPGMLNGGIPTIKRNLASTNITILSVASLGHTPDISIKSFFYQRAFTFVISSDRMEKLISKAENCALCDLDANHFHCPK